MLAPGKLAFHFNARNTRVARVRLCRESNSVVDNHGGQFGFYFQIYFLLYFIIHQPRTKCR